MSASEVLHRARQKRLCGKERKLFAEKVSVFEVLSYGDPSAANLQALKLNLKNLNFTAGNQIELLGGCCYSDYKKRWHASFQGKGDWPLGFSSDYRFSADCVPGDIRTNWELNRHYQFALLAKSYFVTGEKKYLKELLELFNDWNEKNPFLWGPEWASPMEFSVRLINWLFAAAFLEGAQCVEEDASELKENLCKGSWVMAAYIRCHYSKFSSANNHAIVEAAGVAIAAVVFGEDGWLDESLRILMSEVGRQTYDDGVNKEQSLHYQLFVMEAICLVRHILGEERLADSQFLMVQLCRMARYVRDCCVAPGLYVEFGDDDNGAILNLSPNKDGYPDYVLALVSLESSVERWTEEPFFNETLSWLYPASDLESLRGIRPAAIRSFAHYPEGGVTIARRNGIVFAMDHGPLGFGALAAHGHADALSVQLFVDGEPILIDPGTYIYNGDSKRRDLFRSTMMHNTVSIGGRSQSEILGPFLWGRKACVKGLSVEESDDAICVSAYHDGYLPAVHKRVVIFRENGISVIDEIGQSKGVANFIVPRSFVSDISSLEFEMLSGRVVRVETTGLLRIENVDVSPAYGCLEPAVRLSVSFSGELKTVFSITGGIDETY